MSFLYPLGLLGLIAIPVLILIYILKNKHTEQVVSSTYLWTLSERFLKKKNPISKISGIISLILQILIIACISVALAHPVFRLPNAAYDYVFILDGSGSMYFEEDGETRFELAKKEIAKMIEKSPNGSTYTLICAGESTGVLLDGTGTDTGENMELNLKKSAISILEEAKPTATSPALVDARGLAQEIFAENPAAKIYLVTDKSYDNLENVTLVSVATKQENYAVADLSYVLSGGSLEVKGKAYSYESDAELTISLEVIRENGSQYVEDTFDVAKLAETEFSFTVENQGFSQLKVRVQNGDAMPLDDETVLYNTNSARHAEESQVLIVTKDEKQSFLLKSGLAALEYTADVAIMEGDESKETVYKGESGYQLYIFDGCSPTVLPKDGAVWFINPQSTVDNAGFRCDGVEPLSEPRPMTYSDSTATRVQELLKDVQKNKIQIGGRDMEDNRLGYVKCTFLRKFHTLLSYAGYPMVAAGTNSYGNREVVFAFDFNESDFTLTADYVILMRNLLNFTFPVMVENTSLYCGENLTVNVLANSQSIRIDTPQGDTVYLDTGGDSDLVEHTLTEVGEYTVTQMVGGVSHVAHVYGNLPMEERASTVNDGAFVVTGTPSEERRDGRYDDLIILFILLAVIFIADWMVYSYEQYQLR